MSANDLYHYGVLGMKWGVRRFQNSDGSLNTSGKQRVAKKYKKAADAGDRKLKANYNRIYVDAYNKSADYMNTGGIEKFNKQQEKKHGEQFAKRAGYEDDYMNLFSKKLDGILSKSLVDFHSSNKNYKKADEFVKKYDMTTWDELAKHNQEEMDLLRSKFK